MADPYNPWSERPPEEELPTFVVQKIRPRRKRSPLPVLAAIGLLVILGLLIIPRLVKRSAAGDAPEGDTGLIYITATPVIYPASSDEELPGAAPPEGIPELPTLAFSFITATPVFERWDTNIVYVCHMEGSDDICLMKADGSDQHRLTDSPGTDWYPSFSPDGQRIVYSSQRDGQFNIYTMDLNGENHERLTHNHGEDYAPAFSPDGSKIVFTSTYGGDQNIWVMNADGSGLVQLTSDPSGDIDPMWSPDGSRISFTSGRFGMNDLFIMNADGSDVRRVTKYAGLGGRNDWSPDGRYLTFYAGPEHDKDLFLVETVCADEPDGCLPDQLRRLTQGGNNKGPSFSPDGEWITYASGSDENNEVFIIHIDSLLTRQLTFNNYPDWQPRWRP